MEKAHVTPIHKKGSKVVPGNYRAVSLTSVIGKMMGVHSQGPVGRTYDVTQSLL